MHEGDKGLTEVKLDNPARPRARASLLTALCPCLCLCGYAGERIAQAATDIWGIHNSEKA